MPDRIRGLETVGLDVSCPRIYCIRSLEATVPTKLLGTPPLFQCILMTLRVLEKIK